MSTELLNLFKEICEEFEPYNHLKTDLYKGKIIGGDNVYYKKGENDKEGMITGKKNIKRFELEKFPFNFKTYTRYDMSKAEYGWCGDELKAVLNHIKEIINS